MSLCSLILRSVSAVQDDTLYFNFSRPSKSMLLAQRLAIQITHHMIPGIAAIANEFDPLDLINPSKNTTPPSAPLRIGNHRIGPSSMLLGSIPCLRGRK